jgi:hypothetical protein
VVIVPGFGGLLTKYKPAEINSSDNSITPPSKYIIFDKNLVASDGFLSNYIAQQKKINIQDADIFISNEVVLLNQKLDAGETLMFEGIGYISKKDNIIRFEREQEANFLTDTFGLSKVGYKNVEIKLSHQPIQNHEYIPEHKKKRHLLVYLFLIAIVLGGSVFAYIHYPNLPTRLLKKFQHTFAQKQILSPPNIDSQKKNQNDTSRVNDLEKFFDSATDKKKALAIKKESISKLQKFPEGTFYIIAGSFNTYERALIFSKLLNKRGYKSEVIQFNEDTFRVSLGEYNDKDQALVELKKIRTDKGDATVWLLSKLHN